MITESHSVADRLFFFSQNETIEFNVYERDLRDHVCLITIYSDLLFVHWLQLENFSICLGDNANCRRNCRCRTDCELTPTPKNTSKELISHHHVDVRTLDFSHGFRIFSCEKRWRYISQRQAIMERQLVFASMRKS